MAQKTYYFRYGAAETDYLRKRDPVLGAVIDAVGPIRREVIPDLYASLVNHIVAQQISSKAAVTVWNRLKEALGAITPERVHAADDRVIQQCGMSMRKVAYIKETAAKALDGTLDLERLHALPDAEVCRQLAALRGIGVWTAEMLMTFSMRRPDVMSWDDLAIHRGLRMVYRHRRITRKLFDKYRRRYSPHATVACLYLWAASAGACPGLSDPAPLSPAQKKARAAKRKKEGVAVTAAATKKRIPS